jgi:hypothetical protein
MDDENRRKNLKPNPSPEYVTTIVSQLWTLSVSSCQQLESYDGVLPFLNFAN